MSSADNTNSGATERAADVLGHLYALAAAHISGDQDAVAILLEDVPAATQQVLPEAALAIAYTSIRMFRNGDDPFDDPLVTVLPQWMLDTLASVLGGEPLDLIPLYESDPSTSPSGLSVPSGSGPPTASSRRPCVLRAGIART